MKNMKRILLGLVAVFATILLVACSSKTVNGTYEYQPGKEELKTFFSESGAPSDTLDLLASAVKMKVTLEIKDTKGSIKISADSMGQKTEQSFDMKVDQAKQTISGADGTDPIKYSLKGNTMTLDLSSLDSGGDHETEIGLNFLKGAKFKKVK